MTTELAIEDLHAGIEGKEILRGVNLRVAQGEVHAVMGPNGSGKSTLANVIAGHPKYKVLSGDIKLNGESIVETKADERAKKGLFLGFQYPMEVPGVSIFSFLRMAYNSVKGVGKGDGPESKAAEYRSVVQFQQILKERMKLLEIDESFANRYLNEGFSGGEKKRGEVLQMSILEPKIAVLDETDSGLDIDALRIVANGINVLSGPERGILLITHYQRILRYVKPMYVHVMIDGRLVKSGGEELALQLEEKGYDWIIREMAGN